MNTWLKRHRLYLLLGLLLIAILAGAAFILWKLFTSPFLGNDTASKVTVAGLALIGVLATASVSLIGLMLKQSIDGRTLKLSEQAALDRVTEQQRLQMEAAMQTVKLMSLDSGEPAPAIQVSAALLVLAKLGEISLAIDLAAETWPKEQINSSAGVRIIDHALTSNENDPHLQRSSALLLLNNYERLDITDNQYEWPTSLDVWPMKLDPEAREMIAHALSRWLKKRLPIHKNDFRLKLIEQAYGDPDKNVRAIAGSVTGLSSQQALPSPY